MKDLQFSINSWIFGKTPIEEIARLSKQVGVDGLDISGEPDTTDIAQVKNALSKYGLKAFAINGNFTDEERVFCHGDAAMRASAVESVKSAWTWPRLSGRA